MRLAARAAPMICPPGVGEAAFAGLFLLVIGAAVVQRLSGMGFGTIVAPVAALAAPEYVPSAILLLGLGIAFVGAGMDLRRDQLREVGPLVLGRLIGTAPAVLAVEALVGGPGIGVAIALTILLGVGASLLGVSVAKTRVNLFLAGGVSGFLATLSSVGAAPVALIYQRDLAKAARGGLNAFFFIGLVFAVVGLGLRGLIEMRHVTLALMLAPALGLGAGLSLILAPHVDGHALKPFALGLSTLAALVLLARSVL